MAKYLSDEEISEFYKDKGGRQVVIDSLNALFQEAAGTVPVSMGFVQISSVDEDDRRYFCITFDCDDAVQKLRESFGRARLSEEVEKILPEGTAFMIISPEMERRRLGLEGQKPQ